MRLKRSMVPDIDSPRSDDRDLTLRWSGRVSLTRRILAVNIFALALLAFGFFYLDSYRSRIVDSRLAQATREAVLIAGALHAAPKEGRTKLLLELARDSGTRVRLFDGGGTLVADTRALGVQNFTLVNPDKQPWGQDAGRFLDAMIDRVVGAERPPLYRERQNGQIWPDVGAVRLTHQARASVWRAPDRTPVITAAAPLPGNAAVMTSFNARDITQTVRIERFRLSIVLLVVTIVSILLSLFLARTIVRPLRRLARAAVRVRLGRAREVVVPRLPTRGDEIGMLARALSDMSQALRARIDATEAFAADVTHELKNPLASLRSAVEGLGMVSDQKLQGQLIAVIRDDVHRLDRLISDISEASRLDAQLSRAKFELIDVGALVAALVNSRANRGMERDIQLKIARRPAGPLMVWGDGARLERVFENLIDNAISFSPDAGQVSVGAVVDGEQTLIWVEDQGPGVSQTARDDIFRRFHSIRPASEEFGKHSGLGLAIARTIVEAHQGQIDVHSRSDQHKGARFQVHLPSADRRS